MATQNVASLRTKDYDVFRTLVRELREGSGLSQEAFSRRLGRPISFMGKIENGTRRLDVIELIEIAAAVDADIVTLITELKRRLRDTTA